ncbi:MAG: hypothetical protein ACT4OY_04555 [Alphaproteobacteria bacterium]
MVLSILGPSRTVLLIAEDALHIYAAQPSGTRLVETIPWDADNFSENVASSIVKDCHARPVLILNDMVEQHYRKERVMRSGVGIMDRAGMIKRKLGMAFPNYPVKASLVLREKTPKEKGKTVADMYIFAAVPETLQLSKTLEAVRLSLARINGFCLLPLESADMIKSLSLKLLEKGEPRSKWVVFIGQHRGGGLRQIVIKDGELALTRMTPVTEDTSNVVRWVSEVHQEFKATMSYLTRFGFQQEDGLHIIAIGNAPCSEAFQGVIEEPCKFSGLTSVEASRHLRLPALAREDFHLAEPLHVGWAEKKKKLILPLRAAQIDQIAQPRKAAMAASLILLISCLGLGYLFTTASGRFIQLDKDFQEAEKKLAQVNVLYEKEVKRKEDLGFDVRLLQSSIAVHDQLEKQTIDMVPFFQAIAGGMSRDMRIDKIAYESLAGKSTPDIADTAAAVIDAVTGEPVPTLKPTFKTTLQMVYPSTTDIDKGNQEVVDFGARLQKIFPIYKVEVTKKLKDYEYREEILVETGDASKKDVAQDFLAEITIQGARPQ